MSSRLVLHIGVMKSGTTYIQSRLFGNRSVLSERQILLPGHQWSRQVRAVVELQNGDDKRWNALAREVDAHDGTSLVSMEFLATLRPELVRRVCHSVDAGVEVVVTARDLNRSIAAMWQETVQNGRSWTWQEHLDGLLAHRPGHRLPDASPPSAGVHFWRFQNLVRIVRNWTRVLGPERVTLVTVPHPGAPRELLWERFMSVVDTDPGGFAPVASENESLGAASALAMRRLNELLRDGAESLLEDNTLRKELLTKQILAARKQEEAAIGLPVAPWVVEHAEEMASRLRAFGMGVVGDWSDLTPVAVPGIDPAQIAERDVTDAALAGVKGLLLEMERKRQHGVT